MANQSRFAHNSHNTHKGETVMTSFVNSLAMILQEHLLRKVEGTALVRFDGILLLGEGQDFDKRFLCIGTPDECARALATAESGCLVSAGDSEVLRQTSKSPAVNLLVTDLPLLKLYNICSTNLSDLSRLRDKLLETTPRNISNLLHTAFRLCQCSAVVVDQNLNLLYEQTHQDHSARLAALFNQELTGAEAVRILFGLQELPSRPAILTDERIRFVCVPLRHNGFSGHLLCSGAPDNWRMDQAALHLRELIEPLLETGTAITAQSLPFQSIFSRIVTENGENDDVLLISLRNLPSAPKPNMRQILIRSELAVSCEGDRPVLKELKKRAMEFFPNANVALMREEVVVLLSSDTLYCPINFSLAEFDAFLAGNRAIAMIANPVSSVQGLRVMYHQCRRTIPIALAVRHDSRERYMIFSRYAQYHLIDVCARAGKEYMDTDDVVYLCHNGVLTLTRYDRAYQNNLRDVLFYYLMNDRSISRTSSQMYMHRNTLIYKVKQIEELLGESLDDPYTRHSLIFSCLLLRYREMYQKEGVILSPMERNRRSSSESKSPF